MKRFQLSFKNLFILFFFMEILISVVLQELFSHSFINHLSVVSLLFFNLGLIIFIIQGGFFDGMIYSFKRLSRSLRKRQFGEEEAEAPLAEMKHRDGSQRWSITWPLIFSSIILFMITLIVACL